MMPEHDTQDSTDGQESEPHVLTKGSDKHLRSVPYGQSPASRSGTSLWPGSLLVRGLDIDWLVVPPVAELQY